MKSKKTEIAWAAGIIDGEGCIHIVRHRAKRIRKSTRDIKTDSLTVVLKVTMGDRDTVERIARIFDQGTVQKHMVRGGDVNASFSWICCARQTQKVLKLIQPYIFTKRKEAALALEFYRHGLAPLGGSGGTTVLAKKLLDKRVRLYWKMRMSKTRWRFYRESLTPGDVREIKSLGLKP